MRSYLQITYAQEPELAWLGTTLSRAVVRRAAGASQSPYPTDAFKFDVSAVSMGVGWIALYQNSLKGLFRSVTEPSSAQ